MWYSNVACPSPALTALLTDTAGRTHGTTVPTGLVRPEVWQQQLAGTVPSMAAPFAALLSATQQPFVTKVNDALCEKAAFCDGRVVLVGDALGAFRPHLAVATEQAARHCLALGRVWEGERTVEQWAGEVVEYAKRMWLASRVAGVLGQGGWRELGKALWVYVVFLVKVRLGKGPRGY